MRIKGDTIRMYEEISEEEVIEMVNYLEMNEYNDEMRVTSIEEIHNMVGLDAYEIYDDGSCYSLGKVDYVEVYGLDNIDIRTDGGHENNFEALKFSNQYGIYFDYPYSSYVFVKGIDGICSTCISGCKENGKEECSLHQGRN